MTMCLSLPLLLPARIPASTAIANTEKTLICLINCSSLFAYPHFLIECWRRFIGRRNGTGGLCCLLPSRSLLIIQNKVKRNI